MVNVKMVLLLTMIIPLLLVAAPYHDLPMVVGQPDGSTVSCFVSGDEFFNYLHDEAGYTIIRSRTDGWLYYAMRNGDEVVPSSHIVNTVDPSTLGIPPRVQITREAYLARRAAHAVPLRDPDRCPTSGNVNNIVIYIRFSDQEEFEPRMYVDEGFNSPTETSMYSYYNEVSHGAVSITSHHYPVCDLTEGLSYQDSHPRAYFSPYNQVTNPQGYQGDTERAYREQQLLVDAIDAIRPEIPADMNLDADNDGVVDNICFIIRGGNDGWAELLWAHSWTLYLFQVYVNNAQVLNFTFQPETQIEVRTLCHEMFHSMGAPDLYHYSYDGFSPAGQWDLMEYGFGHMTAYMKYRYGGWIQDIPVIEDNGVYTLNPLHAETGNCYRINSPNAPNEYAVVEYRHRVPGTYEVNVPGDGLLVWRVNDNLSGQGNAGGPPDELYLFRFDGTPYENGNDDHANLGEHVGRPTFDDASNPYGFLSNGDFMGIQIGNIGTPGDTISFVLWPSQGLLSVEVRSDNPQADLTEAEVTLGNEVYNTDAAGNLTLPWRQGSQLVRVTLPSHTSGEETVAIIPEDITTVRFNLQYLLPPSNLAYSLQGTNLQLNWDFPVTPPANFEQFNIFVKVNNYNFILLNHSLTNNFAYTVNPNLDYRFYVVAQYTNGTSEPTQTVYIEDVNVDHPGEDTPVVTALIGAYPNPFNPVTRLRFSLASEDRVVVNVYNVIGQKVKTLVDKRMTSGTHSLVWDGKDDANRPLASGLYFFNMKSGTYTATQKVILLK